MIGVNVILSLIFRKAEDALGVYRKGLFFKQSVIYAVIELKCLMNLLLKEARP